MKKSFLLLTFVFLFSMNTFARDGSSGCGPGWFVFKDNSLLSSALRATTNGILLPFVTLGMTFGTSNCSKHSIVKLEKERVKFATENYFEIAADSTRGKGEYLLSYGELMGCSQQSLARFSKKIQSNFKKVFPSFDSSPEQIVENTYKVILNDKVLRRSCFQA